MKIPRYIANDVLAAIEPGKVVVLYGPRRVGKTTLLKEIQGRLPDEPFYFLTGEDRTVQEWLASKRLDILRSEIGNRKLVFIDEAQKVDQIGLNLKLLVDHIPDLKIIATGSSSFELANQVGEPLVGRKREFHLYPISQLELNHSEGPTVSASRLEQRLIYGGYPEIITQTDNGERRRILQEIVDTYLYKDIFMFHDLRRSQKVADLLRLVAFQIGQEVSMNELATSLGINIRTVEKYLDLLEKAFVLKRVFGFSRNLRKEVTKNSRFYFYDNGIRNALIENFNTLKFRNDIGQLWENYLFMERLKKREYQRIYANHYFWRTYDQKEIDLVEERDGQLHGYEFKWKPKKVKAPKLWTDTYEGLYEVISPENYLAFIS